MMETTDTLDRIRTFAATLRPEAERLDHDADLLAARYLDFQAAGLNAFGSGRLPLESREALKCLAALSEESGAFAFLALQQWVANMSRPDDGQDTWPRLGVAFGHLRNLTYLSPIWKAGRVTGRVPWLTGAGTFEKLLLGVRLEDGREAYAWVDGEDRERFRYSPPLPLVACSGTQTVTVQITDLSLPEERFVRMEPPGSLAAGDAKSVIYQTPLMIGNLRASLRHIEGAAPVDPALRQQCSKKVDRLIEEIFTALDDGTQEEKGPFLRARAGDFTVRMARLAVMASGGKALSLEHPAQRVYREALLFSLMAQTQEIVNQAFEEVLQ
jgi:hypothetical protein